MVYKKVTRWHCSYILVPFHKKAPMLLLVLYFVQRFILQTNLRKNKDTKMDKKTLNPHTTKGYFYRWHKLPTVTVYMFTLYFSPTFHLPFWGKPVIARLPGGPGERLRSIPAPRCRPENVQRHPVQRLPTFLNGKARRRRNPREDGLGFFVKFFWGEFFLGERFVVLKKVGFYWECKKTYLI